MTLPYNLLLSKTAREALGIDLRGHIVIVDEAHSESVIELLRGFEFEFDDSLYVADLIDTVLSVHSHTLTSSILQLSLAQVGPHAINPLPIRSH